MRTYVCLDCPLLGSLVVEKIRERAPSLTIVYRPHPKLESDENCKLPPLDGVVVRTAKDESLEQAFSGAAVVISATSSALVEVGGGEGGRRGAGASSLHCFSLSLDRSIDKRREERGRRIVFALFLSLSLSLSLSFNR